MNDFPRKSLSFCKKNIPFAKAKCIKGPGILNEKQDVQWSQNIRCVDLKDERVRAGDVEV